MLQIAGSAAFKLDFGMEFISEAGLINGKRNNYDGYGFELAIQEAYGFAGLVLNEDGVPDPFERYWLDTNNNGMIDAGDSANENGIGFAIENMNLGVVYMVDNLTSAKLLAARADLKYAGFVGIPGVTAELREFEFGVNLALGAALTPDPAAIAMAAAKNALTPIISPMINQIIVEANKLSGSFADSVGAAAEQLNDAAFDLAADLNGAVQQGALSLKESAEQAVAEFEDDLNEFKENGLPPLALDGKLFTDPEGFIRDQSGNIIEGYKELATGEIVDAGGTIISNAAGTFKDGVATAATNLAENGKKILGNGSNAIEGASGKIGRAHV